MWPSQIGKAGHFDRQILKVQATLHHLTVFLAKHTLQTLKRLTPTKFWTTFLHFHTLFGIHFHDSSF